MNVSVQPAGNQVHELLTGVQVRQEATGECRGSGDGILLLYTSDLHAHMLCFYDHGHTQWFKILLDAVAYRGL